MLNSRRYVNEALKADLTAKGYLLARLTVAAVTFDLRAPYRRINISRAVQKTLAGEDSARSLAAPTEKQQQDSAQTAQ